MIAQDELIEMCIRDRNKKRRRSVRKNDLKNPFVFAISGYKNSGKTTLITKLIPILKEKGYRVATIKHDGHDFLGDIPGRDSYRHQEAGAYATAVYSQKRFQIMKEISGITEKELIGCFPEADIILLEGLKSSSYPKYVCDFPNTIPDAWEIAEKMCIRDRFKEICEKSHATENNAFSEAVLLGAYEESEEWLDELNAYIEGNLDYAVDYLSLIHIYKFVFHVTSIV